MRQFGSQRALVVHWLASHGWSSQLCPAACAPPHLPPISARHGWSSTLGPANPVMQPERRLTATSPLPSNCCSGKRVPGQPAGTAHHHRLAGIHGRSRPVPCLGSQSHRHLLSRPALRMHSGLIGAAAAPQVALGAAAAAGRHKPAMPCELVHLRCELPPATRAPKPEGRHCAAAQHGLVF